MVNEEIIIKPYYYRVNISKVYMIVEREINYMAVKI